MLRYLVLLLLAVPFIDLYLLFKVVGWIGFWQTLGIVLLTGIAGAEIIRREGTHVVRKLQRSVTAGEMSRNVLEGGMLVLAGIFLLTPGLLTDTMGFLLTFRPLRERLVARISSMDSMNVEFEVHTF
ncbi:MAG: FxsA family protein [Candidatus Nanohaloarchaea archaeon]